VTEDGLFLQHIADSINKIQRYTETGKEQFFQSAMTQDAVIRNFEIIGEATKRLSEQFRSAH